MIAIAISVLFTLGGLFAATLIADTLLKARAAHARLLQEGELLRAGLALQAAAEMRLRPLARSVPRRITAEARPAALRLQAPRACVAA